MHKFTFSALSHDGAVTLPVRVIVLVHVRLSRVVCTVRWRRPLMALLIIVDRTVWAAAVLVAAASIRAVVVSDVAGASLRRWCDRPNAHYSGISELLSQGLGEIHRVDPVSGHHQVVPVRPLYPNRSHRSCDAMKEANLWSESVYTWTYTQTRAEPNRSTERRR